MSLTVYDPSVSFVFIPDPEKEKQESERNYKPFTILHLQMDGDTASWYRAEMSKHMKQTQEVAGKGKDQKLINRAEINHRAMRDLDLNVAEKLIVKATNFTMKEHEYPKIVNGKVTEEWCEDRAILKDLIECLSDDWLSDFIQSARDISALTPYEKKS
jgi:hypothetical protein